MRLVTAALAFAISFGSALAFEKEDQKFFGEEKPGKFLKILSTSDIEIFEPILLGFLEENPGIAIDYTVASSRQVFSAVYYEKEKFDLVISSAMDLQIKIANDNMARSYSSVATQRLPKGAKWRDRIFSFTYEPAVFLISRSAFHGIDIPRSRQELVELVRENADRFRGRIGTYDIRSSGLGYLLASQDSLNSQTYWRLTEVFGLAGTRLYCCSSEMVTDVDKGRLAFAYNVLESYASRKVAEGKPNVKVVAFDDFQTAIMRTVLIPDNADNIPEAESFVDFLITLSDRPELTQSSGFSPILSQAKETESTPGTIKLGPNLLVFLDQIKRFEFLGDWENSMRTQNQSANRRR